MLDNQVASEAIEHGIAVDRPSHGSSEPVSSSDLFLRELQEQAALATPPPLPPAGYNSSPVEARANPTSTLDPTIIDLCSGDEDEEEAQDELQELPSMDLTELQDDSDNEEDCSIIGTGRRGRVGRGGHSVLSIRSRSLSNAVSMPIRPEKRGRSSGRKLHTR